MKKIYNIMAFIICLAAFWGCEDNNDKFHFQEPTEFKLNTPPYASGIYDLINTETIELTCSQPDYGFTAATVYRVHVSIDPDFPDSTTTTLNTAYTTAKMDVDAKEMAVALVEAQTKVLDIQSEEDYPTEPFPVYIKLSAELTNGDGFIYSNSITLPNVKGYYALEDPELPTTMYINGSMNDFDWSKALEMIPVYDNPGMFWRLAYFPDGATLKFNSAKEWDGNEVGYSEDIFTDNSIAYAGLEEDDGNIKVTNGGWYLVVISTSIDGRTFVYDVEFLEPKVYLTGDPSGGYDIFDDARLFSVPDGEGEFVSPEFIANGELRMCVKLENIDWWKSEFVIFDGEISYRGTGGDQDRVAVSAGQKAYLNFTEGTGRVE